MYILLFVFAAILSNVASSFEKEWQAGCMESKLKLKMSTDSLQPRLMHTLLL